MTTLTKTQTVIDAALCAIREAEHPLTSSDLYDRLHIEPTDTVIHTAIRALLENGQIEMAGIVPGRRGTPAKSYRLVTDAQRLMTHLEADLDNAAISQNGDESTVDPVIQALTSMSQRHFTQDAERHIERLRALATHLDNGKSVLPQMDLVAWLFDLASEIEDLAA